jgi:hypothetical protein
LDLSCSKRKNNLTKCCNPRTTCAGQFVTRGFVVLLRKSNPQTTTYKLPLSTALTKNSLMKKFLILLVAFTALVSAGVVGVFLYSTKNMCGNEVFKEVYSPNQELKAVIFQRDCGATTGFSTQVSLLAKAEALPNESGNILIIEGHPNDTLLEVIWLSDGELKIPQNLNGSEFKAEKSIYLNRKIIVSYSNN